MHCALNHRDRIQAMIYHSGSPEITIPEVTLPEHVLRTAAARGDKPALVDALTGQTLSYRQLDDLSARAATALTDAGIKPGDTIALVSHNQPMYAVAVYAILRAGAVLTPVNPALHITEIAKQLQDSGAKAVISAENIAAKVSAARSGSATSLHYLLGGIDHASSFDTLFASESATSAVPQSVDTIAVLPFSSGTTGASKGVMLSHHNLVANLEQLRTGWRLTDDDVVCAALPLFHIYGFTVILSSALLAGATVVTLPRFDLRTYLRTVQTYKVSRGHLAPPTVLALAHAPDVDEFDLSSMRIAISGAAPLDADLVKEVAERTGIDIRQGYGMTEASPGTHSVADEDFDSTPPRQRRTVAAEYPGEDHRSHFWC
jgi:acyl-CoA synthetase (AMP-forming)/AMP-acid ligase II